MRRNGLFKFFIDHAGKVGERILNREPGVSAWDRLLYKIGDIVVYAPLKNRFGLTDIKVGYTAGEAIGPEIFRFYRSIGVNLKQLYGQTEASVYVTMQPDGEIRADTVGRPRPPSRSGSTTAARSSTARRASSWATTRTRRRRPRRRRRTASSARATPDSSMRRATSRSSTARRTWERCATSLFPPKYVENKLVLSQHQGGRGLRRRARLRLLLHQHRPRGGRQLGRAHGVTYASYQELAGHPLVYSMIEKR